MKKKILFVICMLLLISVCSCLQEEGLDTATRININESNSEYKYTMELEGTLPNTNEKCKIVVLSNDKTITFDEALSASGLSSNLDDYFDVEIATIVSIEIE